MGWLPVCMGIVHSISLTLNVHAGILQRRRAPGPTSQVLISGFPLATNSPTPVERASSLLGMTEEVCSQP